MKKNKEAAQLANKLLAVWADYAKAHKGRTEPEPESIFLVALSIAAGTFIHSATNPEVRDEVIGDFIHNVNVVAATPKKVTVQ
jgi:hypothetical protein